MTMATILTHVHPASPVAGIGERRRALHARPRSRQAPARTLGSDQHVDDRLVKISVLIATHQRPAALRAAVESLCNQTRPPDEVIIATWAGDTESYSVVQSLTKPQAPERPLPKLVSVVTTENTVLAKENTGMRAASGDVICFTDDDAVAHRDWIERLQHHYADTTVGAVGGRDIVIKEGRHVPTREVTRVGSLAWFGRLVGNHHEQTVGARDVDFLKGCNMSFRRDVLSPVDPCLVGTIPYGFEIDMGLTVRALGRRVVYEPEAQVDHYASSDMSARHAALARTTNHNQTYILLKHLSWPRKLVFLLYSFAIGDGNTIGLLRVPWLAWRAGWTSGELRAHFAGKVAGTRSYLRILREEHKR